MASMTGKDSTVFFADEELKGSFEKLEKSNPKMFGWINGAIDKLKANPFAGVQVRRKLIPKTYVERFGIDNLWKMNLPDGWRLMYSVGMAGVSVVSIVLEWLPHKKYERRFGY
jgi:hypothetical protein